MKQKDIFLSGEGNAWFDRNADTLAKKEMPGGDPLLLELLSLQVQFAGVQGVGKVLEIGCGAGGRLAWVQQYMGLECYGIEPSESAVSQANRAGVRARVGTADELPFAEKFFDVVIFGFCLYLCDRDDLFKIAAEADRVLKNQSWLLIKDFYSPEVIANAYHHKADVYSYKMDYKTLFTWNPDYNVYSNRVVHHAHGNYTDDRREWVATSVLRKCRQS
jgi:ubiquinone/menaquinone biosynthesis C-methylase UbiE